MSVRFYDLQSGCSSGFLTAKRRAGGWTVNVLLDGSFISSPIYRNPSSLKIPFFTVLRGFFIPLSQAPMPLPTVSDRLHECFRFQILI